MEGAREYDFKRFMVCIVVKIKGGGGVIWGIIPSVCTNRKLRQRKYKKERIKK